MIARRGVLVIAVAIVAGLAARLYLAATYQGNYDERSYEIVSAIVRAGGNVYSGTDRYNYSPVWAYVLLALDHVRSLTGAPPHLVIRGALTFVDLLVATALAAIAGRREPGREAATFAAYFLNPVAILVVGYHGQFEVLASLPLLVAIWANEGSRPHPRLTWTLGTLSLLVKHLLVFQVWMLFTYAFSRRGRIVSSVGAGAVFMLSFVPFWADASDHILRNVLGYGGLPGIYGFGSLLPRVVSLPLLVAVMAVLPDLARSRLGFPLPQGLAISGVTLLMMIDGIGEQYFLIPIIFGSMFPRSWGFWLYTGVAGAFLLGSPNNIGLLPVRLPWNAVWLAAIAWTGQMALSGARRPLTASRRPTRL